MLPALGAWLALSPCSLVAQAPNEFDFDTAQLAVTTIPPNGATHAITTLVTYTNQNLVLNAPLTVRAGAELRLVRSVLKVFGTIVMEEGSRITVIDSSLFLPCQFTRQYELRNEGGLLHTERAVLGSTHVGSTLSPTSFQHHRGAWLARNTVVQAFICVIGDGRTGYGNPQFKGGSVFADGLYEGALADAVHASGMGDVSFANGTMNVGFYYDASASVQPAAATLDLDSRSPLDIVYGDPTVHSGVTAPIARSPCRVELRNHRSATWQLFAVNASSAGPLQTITLRNADEIICSFRGVDLVGSPVFGGPWASHYAEMPGLPSTERPGHHAMPPGCSVRLGNVMFQSGPGANDWNRIRYWGLYARGVATNLTVTGPTALAEVQLTDGQIHLAGAGSFDLGLLCQTVRLYGTANLQITNAAVGGFGTGNSAIGLIEANEASTCTITDSRMAPMRLKTTSGAASITTQNLFSTQSPIIDDAGGGVIQVIQATPGQNWDRQNLDFEGALLAGGVPPFWSAQSVTGSLVADAAPGAGGASSYALMAQAAGALLRKQLSLPAGTFVTLIGSAKVVQAPAGGAQLSLQASNGATVMSRAIDLLQPNAWQRVHVPVLTVGAATPSAFVQVYAGGLPATVRLDGFRVHLGSWWDNDNLGNLGFEGGYRFQGLTPTTWTAPDAWRASTVVCVADTGSVRPGALPGSRSVRMTLEANTYGDIRKDLTFLRQGDTVVVGGWVRGVSANAGARAEVIVGNGDTFYVVGLGNNQHSGALPFDGVWRQFQLTYVVPNNPSYTRIDLGTYDVPGTQCWYDDITVSIR